MPARLAAVTLLLLLGCTEVSPTQTLTPTDGSLPPASASALTTTPNPTATSTSGSEASLTITGRGKCTASNFGGCWPVLLLEQTAPRHLFDWAPADGDLEFAVDGQYPDQILTGVLPNAPTSLAEGTWAIGLGVGESSDVAEVPSSGTVICVREFEVSESTSLVSVIADFDFPCSITVDIDPPLHPDPTSTPVRVAAAPIKAKLDDCRFRRLLLRFDADGTVWYQDVDSGDRVELGWPEFSGWSIEASGSDRTLVSPENEVALPEWSIRGEQCLLVADGALWIGNTETAWQPWVSALEPYGEVVQTLIQIALDMPPAARLPAAVSVTPRPSQPTDSMLSHLDREIRRVGPGNWSEVFPEFFLGQGGSMRPDGSGQMGLIDEDWRVYPSPEAVKGLFDSADGWSARPVLNYSTPASNTVSTLGEIVAVWEDCSNVVLPPIYPGSIEPGFETGYDPEGELMTVYIYSEDQEDITTLIVDMSDEACREHPQLGPMIEGLLDG